MTKPPPSEVVAGRRLRELLDDAETHLDEELTRNVAAGRDLFVVKDGRVLLLLPNQTGRLYDCGRVEFRAWDEELKAEAAAGPMDLTQFLPPPDEFVSAVPKLVSDLAVALGLDLVVLDRTEESLSRVDEALRGSKIAPLSSELFGPLTAYVGEVVRSVKGGTWRNGTSPKGRWRPEILMPSGRSLSPAELILKEVAEYTPRDGSIRAVVSAALVTIH